MMKNWIVMVVDWGCVNDVCFPSIQPIRFFNWMHTQFIINFDFPFLIFIFIRSILFKHRNEMMEWCPLNYVGIAHWIRLKHYKNKISELCIDWIYIKKVGCQTICTFHHTHTHTSLMHLSKHLFKTIIFHTHTSPTSSYTVSFP